MVVEVAVQRVVIVIVTAIVTAIVIVVGGVDLRLAVG